MDKNNIKQILYIILAIVIAIIAVKLFIWLLPIVLIIIVAFLIYNSMKPKKTTKSNKKVKIIDAKNDDE